MSRRSEKKSKSSKKNKSAAEQPWEQSIYDTKYETSETRTRSNQRKRKSGDTKFLTWLVILLVLIISVPTLAVLYLRNEDSGSASKASSESSSTVISSTTATTSSTEASSTSEIQATESSAADDGQDAVDGETDTDTNTDDASGDYAVVQSGDGPYTFASRNGITVEELYALNGMNESSMLQPGQSLRIR